MLDAVQSVQCRQNTKYVFTFLVDCGETGLVLPGAVREESLCPALLEGGAVAHVTHQWRRLGGGEGQQTGDGP